MTPAEVKFAEEPLFMLIEKDVTQMTQDELHKHVELLRTLRRAPQSLSAKLVRDEASLDAQHGEPEVKKIRRRVNGENDEKLVQKKTAVLGAKLADKWDV